MGINAWKSKVKEFSRFKESLKTEYVFAEEVLDRIEECLSLPAKYSRASVEETDEMADSVISVLYFKLQDNKITKEKTKLIPSGYSLMPFCDGKPDSISFTNIGGASKGFSLYFAGPFVENEEIRFDELSQSPYFTYTDGNTGIEHEVWFEDVRSLQKKFDLIKEFHLRGCGYWQIMQWFRANWLLLAENFYTIKDV